MEFVETMFCENQKIELLDFHLDRLKWGLYQNGFQAVNHKVSLSKNYILSQLPDSSRTYRVRYLIDVDFDIVSQSVEYTPIDRCSFEIYKIGCYESRVKLKSSPWNAKTTHRDIYNDASQWAKENDFDDAIILNENGFVIETTIFSIFILKDGILYTPPLSDMPVKGVMRSWMMSNCVFPIIEKSLTIEDVENADYILLINAVRGIQLGHFSK